MMMLKNLLRLPDTFDPDDQRRRQILNILLICFAVVSLLIFSITLMFYPHLDDQPSRALAIWEILEVTGTGFLLVANRSPRVPSWINGTVFIAILIVGITQSDTVSELYNGRSLIAWVLPI
jgi:hypothetical protein